MRATTRQAVLDSAMRLFGQNGYAHTSTRSIAKDAKISAGLLYHYFDSKENLLQAVIDHSISRINAAIGGAMESSSPHMLLTNVLKSIFDLLASDPAFWTLFNMLRSQPSILREHGDEFRYLTSCLRELFEAQLREHQRPDPALDAYVIYCLVEGTIQQYLLDPASYPLDAVVARILEQYDLPLE